MPRVTLLKGEYHDSATGQIHSAGVEVNVPLGRLAELVKAGFIDPAHSPKDAPRAAETRPGPHDDEPHVRAKILRGDVLIGTTVYSEGDEPMVPASLVEMFVKSGHIAPEHAPHVTPRAPAPVPNGGPTRRIRTLVPGVDAPVPGLDSLRVDMPVGSVVETTARAADVLIERKHAVETKERLTDWAAEPRKARAGA